MPLLDDLDPRSRANARDALASLEESPPAGSRRRRLDDIAPNVQLEAALALAALGTRAAKGAARRFDVREHVSRRSAMRSVLRAQLRRPVSRWPRSPCFLARCARAARRARAAAPARLGDARGVEALRRVLRGLRSDARSYAVEWRA